MTKSSRYFVLTVFVILATGCATPSPEREMNSLASALTKLAAAVDASVRYDDPMASMSETNLLRLATAHDPSLMAPFVSFELHVQRVGSDSSVLICRASAGQAVLEDAGCTALMERHHWKSQPALACEPTLDLHTICKK